MNAMQLEIFSCDKVGSGNPGETKAVSLASSDMYGKEIMVKTARRIARRLKNNPYNELSVRVAIENDKSGKQLHEMEKRQLTRMVRGEMEGYFPLPGKGITYSASQWEGLYWYLREIPECAEFIQRCNESSWP